jgi:tRNA-binding protein
VAPTFLLSARLPHPGPFISSWSSWVVAGSGRVLASALSIAGQTRTGNGDIMTIGYDDFLKVDIRVGTIVDAQDFPEARRPAYRLWVDFGEELGIKKTSAQITKYYDLAALPGRQVAAVVNFPPKQIGPVMSEVLVLGFPDADGEVVLAGVDHPVPNGGRLF